MGIMVNIRPNLEEVENDTEIKPIMGVILINNTNHWFLPLIICSENTQKK